MVRVTSQRLTMVASIFALLDGQHPVLGKQSQSGHEGHPIDLNEPPSTSTFSEMEQMFKVHLEQHEDDLRTIQGYQGVGNANHGSVSSNELLARCEKIIHDHPKVMEMSKALQPPQRIGSSSKPPLPPKKKQ
ncbi:hypothetical protein ABG067_007846 [Albugo candida]